MMVVTSTVRMIVPALLLVAASGAALVFAFPHAWPEQSIDAGPTTAAPAVSPSASAAPNQDLAGLGQGQAQVQAQVQAQAQAEVTAALGGLAGMPSPLEAGGVPAFDIARISPTGDAVIAGRAAPGATVELLLGGKVYVKATADQSGQFVMVPPRLPSGNYELTLRSEQQGGMPEMSKQSVKVALLPGSGDPARADQAAQPPAQASKRQELASVAAQQATAPAPSPNESAPAAPPKTATTVVSGGDSLWRLSRLNYGKGEQYSAIYDANRKLIRNPNLIYPGQVFIIPTKPR
jgi:nucleoid-associated protein YgaU